GTVAAAEAAAHRAFSTLPTLPLDQDTLAHGTALEGRQRLTGAFLIDVARIRPDPDQPRRACDTQAQWELSASIAKVGILQPITVRYIERDNVYQVITGERRFQAAKALGLSAIPCWMKTPKADDILVHQIVENWQRRDLEPLELARALALLRDSTGSSQKALAALTGKPESEVSRLLSLLKLTPDVQAQAEETPRGTVTKRHLVALAQLPPEDQQEVMIAVREKHLTALDTEHVAREAKAKETGVTSRGAPLTQRLRYLTANALVTLTFRRRNVTAQDILAALDAVREQVTKARDEDRASA
ncbi:MAG TPA: ParB/RepB/Spo0J family partition protein, partial [Gemmataceae bacterium]|nr:ParB/RepB/Spo0J family partition protein [Gemmataceae bacterium]